MDAPALTGNAILNAIAVWFIFKAIEVMVFVIYDSYCAVAKRIRNLHNPDADPLPSENKFERRRGWIEYVLSGTGFLNPDLCQQKKMLLLSISTILPLIVFVLELMSITLSNETRTCKTSRDPNIISSPSLVLFGEGMRQVNLSAKTFGGSGIDISRGSLRPCVTWSSSHAGVDYLSTICGDTMEAADHTVLVGSRKESIGVFIPKRMDAIPHNWRTIYAVFGVLLQSNTSLGTGFILGSFKFQSEVVVNGRNFLFRDAFFGDQISEKQKNQLVRDYRLVEQRSEFVPGTYLEDDLFFGFAWDDPDEYQNGSIAMVFAVLAQATREPMKTAAEMSSRNRMEDAFDSFDISCEEDFRLPRTASIITIIIGVICRFVLIFIPAPKSSVEYALEKSEEHSREQTKGTP